MGKFWQRVGEAHCWESAGMTLYARLAALLVILAALSAGMWKAYTMGKNTVRAEWAIEREAANEKARESRERNRTTALTAEKIYIDRERVRTEFLVTTMKEVTHETANLATCALDAGDVGLLNAAAHRAFENRPAAAGADNALPTTR